MDWGWSVDRWLWNTAVEDSTNIQSKFSKGPRDAGMTEGRGGEATLRLCFFRLGSCLLFLGFLCSVLNHKTCFSLCYLICFTISKKNNNLGLPEIHSATFLWFPTLSLPSWDQDSFQCEYIVMFCCKWKQHIPPEWKKCIDQWMDFISLPNRNF